MSRYGVGLVLDPTMHADETVGQPQETRYAVAKKSVTDSDIRCQGEVTTAHGNKTCNRLLAEKAGRPWSIVCPRCKTRNQSPPET